MRAAAAAVSLLALVACHGNAGERPSPAAPSNAPGADPQVGFATAKSGTTPPPAPNVAPPAPATSAGYTELPEPIPGKACLEGGLEQACALYVDPETGNDVNHGRTPDKPLATLKTGYGRLREGSADQLLLRRGRTFTDSFVMWKKSGHSKERPIVLGAYGEGPRPVLHSKGKDGLHISPGFKSDQTVRHVAFVGLAIHSRGRNPKGADFDPKAPGGAGIHIVGVKTTGPVLAEDLLIEDCHIAFYGGGIAVDGAQGVKDLRIRRNLIVDIYTRDIGNGIYLSHAHDVLIEENLIDRTKWNQLPDLWPNPLDHSIYVQSNTSGITIRGNIFARAFDGAMQRTGGIFDDNVVYQTTIGNHQGFIFGGTTPVRGGVEFRVRGNAFLKIGGPNGEPGLGIQAGNIKSGAIEGNLIMMESAPDAAAIRLMGSRDKGNAGVLALSGRRNTATYDGHEIQRIGNTFRNVAIEPLEKGPAAGQDLLALYNVNLGGPKDADAFLAEAAKQSTTNWRKAYTAAGILEWLRAQGHAPTPD